MSRPQPYRIDWTIEPTSLEDCSDKLATQFESIDQMFQLLFEDLSNRVITLTSEVTGVLPVLNGGTNTTGVTIGGVAYGASGAVTGAAYKFTTAGTAGHYLRSSGAAAPVFSQIDLATTGVSGILPVANGGTGLAAVSGTRIPYGSGTSPLNSTGTFIFDGTLFSLPGQIGFPATQVASTGVNVLDDYEEGTWTPIITGSTSTVGVTYSTQAGFYVKIGRYVQVHGAVVLSATGTIVGDVRIGGLPFASTTGATFRATVPVKWSAMTTAFTLVQGSMVTGATVFTLDGATGATINLTTAVQPADLAATSTFTFGFGYLTET